MYVPPFNAMDDAELRSIVDAVGSAELITVGDDGFPVATRLPVLWHKDRLVLHMAFANPHWRGITDGAPALAVVTGPEAYISPSWYAAKDEHGRVVPTWNYSAVHFTGLATVHRDPEWLRTAVTELTDLHEGRRPAPWAVTDAPETYVEQQLKAIVGVELAIQTVEGKAKRSQNRSDADRTGVVAGLREDGGARDLAMADQMEHDLEDG
ncbi:MAG: transcriptional regulator [Nocardioidaceae bacterium]|jgi:transcriptional regulator|nr:transcriptional regulator [Nocardioidaceae bacterium]